LRQLHSNSCLPRPFWQHTCNHRKQARSVPRAHHIPA
jgi:hypothetical protein